MLELTQIENLQYDPTAIQHYLLDSIDKGINGTIPDVTSPFMMLLEANTTLTVNALEEMLRYHRRTFPELANTREDIFSHMHDYEYIDIFSTPSEAHLIFLLNVKDIEYNGIDRGEYKEVTIPNTTTVTVRDKYKFTLLNDITIKLYNNKRVAIEQQLNNLVSEGEIVGLNPISITNLGVIDGHIITDVEGIEYVAFETRVKQINRDMIEGTIIAGIGFNKTIQLSEGYRYYHSEVYLQTDNGWKLIDTTHSDIVFDVNKPTVWIRNLDDKVTFKLPTIYSDTLTGNIRIVLYSTLGEVNIPLDKYAIQDFIIQIENSGESESTAVSPYITTLCKSIVPCVGGRNGKRLEEIRELIINNAIGNPQLPITEKQLIEDVYNRGFSLEKSHDIVTERVYVASRFTNTDSSVKAKLDPLIVKLVVKGEMGSKFIKQYPEYECTVIKDGLIVREDNGIIRALTDTEYNEITVLNNKAMLPLTLSEKRYFYTLYQTVISYNENVIDSRVYSLTNPRLINLRIISKNDSLEERVNSNSYSIEKIEDGYSLRFKIKGNKEFERLEYTTIFGQIKLMVNDIPIYFRGECDSNYIITFTINSNFVIDEEDKLVILNGVSDLKDKRINLTENIELILYTVNGLVEKTNYLYNSKVVVDSDIQAFSVENIQIELGYRMKYMWNRVLSNYSERVPKRYKTDIPAVYKEDVYEVFEETNSIFRPNGDGLVTRLLHRKGDLIKDRLGNPIYAHRKGDVVIGEDGLPIIDKGSEVMRTVDLAVVEYEFIVADNSSYRDYLKRSMRLLETWIRRDMDSLNRLTLDNTTILFRPHKVLEPIPIKINNYSKKVKDTVVPDITLFVTKKLDIEQDELEDIVGEIVDVYLENKIVRVSELRELLISKLGSSVVGVKVKRLTDILDLEAFTVLNNNRISVKKKIEKSEDNSLVVRYDVVVNVIEI